MMRLLRTSVGNVRRIEVALPTSQEGSSMLPLLSLHAIAAQRGDGLHPVLLAGLHRLVTKPVGNAPAQTSRGHRPHTAEPTADNIERNETAKLPQDEQRPVPHAADAFP